MGASWNLGLMTILADYLDEYTGFSYTHDTTEGNIFTNMCSQLVDDGTLTFDIVGGKTIIHTS
jgi:hypothetical protein